MQVNHAACRLHPLSLKATSFQRHSFLSLSTLLSTPSACFGGITAAHRHLKLKINTELEEIVIIWTMAVETMGEKRAK
jgi:hypothetical protein